MNDWFDSLVADCRDIIGKCEFTSRWALVEGYHNFGKRILAEHDNFDRAQIYGGEVVAKISEAVGKNPRTVWRSIQFAKKYPDLKSLPGGKDMTWTAIYSKLLPVPQEKEEVKVSFDGVESIVRLAIELSDTLDHLDREAVPQDALDFLNSQLRITAGKLGKFLLNDRPKSKLS